MILFIKKRFTADGRVTSMQWGVSLDTINEEHGVHFTIIWPENIQTQFVATSLAIVEEQQFLLETREQNLDH